MSRLSIDRSHYEGYSRPVVIDGGMLMDVDARLGPLAARQRLPLAALAVYGMIAAWPEDEAPTSADLAAYSGTPVHEMDQIVAQLIDHGYVDSEAQI